MNTKELEPHFLQSNHWQAVRDSMGHKTIRVGEALLLIKRIPFVNLGIGYMPQVYLEKLDWKELERIAREQRLSHIHLDPSDIASEYVLPISITEKYRLKPTESIYYRHTTVLDLTKGEEQLLAQMKSKTRYNTRLSLKKDIKVKVDDSEESFQTFLQLFFETVKRQKYYGRDEEYYKTIWRILKPKGRVKIATAYYKDKPLVSWMLFLGENKVIYYPYGGSSEKERNRMPANALVWEVIRFGKQNGYKYFDLWGTLPEDASEKTKGYGFSRFKKGFGGTDLAYTPSSNLIISRFWYSVFISINRLRWIYLNLRKLI